MNDAKTWQNYLVNKQMNYNWEHVKYIRTSEKILKYLQKTSPRLATSYRYFEILTSKVLAMA